MLKGDDLWFSTVEEAVRTQLPRDVRNLFCLLLANCELTDPLNLWNRFKEEMSYDLSLALGRMNLGDQENDENKALIENECLCRIEDMIMSSVGKNLSDFGIPRSNRDLVFNEREAIEFEGKSHTIGMSWRLF